MKSTLAKLTNVLVCAVLPAFLLMGAAARAYADAPASLYKPALVSSFGPNGTHWPDKIPTPFMYDISVPHVIEVECTWDAIKKGIESVTDEMADAGVLIQVKPGELVGKGSGAAESNSVIVNTGKSTWTKRVTVAPRDGIGTVKITTSTARVSKVRNVCFAGFVGNGFMVAESPNLAVAWSKFGTLYVYNANSAPAVSGMEFVEVVIDPVLLGSANVGANRLAVAGQINLFNPIRLLSGGNVSDTSFVGCYVMPLFQSNKSQTASVYFDDTNTPVGTYDLVFKDTAIFASTIGAFRTNQYTIGLNLDNCYVVGDPVSITRYPVPTGAATPTTATKTIFTGRGKGISVANSVVVGDIVTTADDVEAPATSPFDSVINTKADRMYSDAAQTPATGGWGAPNIGDITPTATITDVLMPPDATDAYLYATTGELGIWSVGAAPTITAQPVAPAGTQSAGVDIDLSVAATGKFVVYQWKKDGVDIPGANSATYTISNASSEDTGSYTVKVFNMAGEETSEAAAVSVTGTPLYRPATVSSFGPNGTHWPNKISTPFMYDYSLPHVREVECDWEAIKAAINAVTETEASEGVLLLVKPGELAGKGASAGAPSAANSVIIDAGSKAWTRRVTVAPRDGIGSVVLGTATTTVSRLVRVNGVCFAGFVGKGFMFSDCSNSAIAWSNIGYLYVHSRDDTGLDCENNEFVEVVFDMSLMSGDANRLTHVNNIFPLRFTNNKNYDNASIDGCYIMPIFQNTGHTAAVQSMVFERTYPGIHTNITVKDTAIFAGSGGAIYTNDKVDGLQIKHSYIVADPVSTKRYPVPAGTNTAALPASVKAITGNGDNYVLVDSVVVGDIDLVLSGTAVGAKNFASVTNTVVDRIYIDPEQAPATGAWGMPAGTTTPVADITTMMPPDATPAHLYSGPSAIWSFAYPAPVFETELAATTTATTGDTVTLSVEVTVDSKFVAYQWSKDGDAISGATEASYVIANAATTDSGNYTVTVTNAAGSATSTTVLTVGGTPSPQLPVITTQPGSATVNAGAPFSLSVVATDPLGGTLTYKWYKDSTEIPGATVATIGKASVGIGDAGTYYVEITNADGTTTSDNAVITVIADSTPSIPVQPPGSRVVLEGGTITLTASYAGTPTPTIKWEVSTDGGVTWTEITTANPAYSGAGTDSLTILDANSGMDGWMYHYVLENSEGSITSGSTTLTVSSSDLYIPTEVASRGPNGTHWPKTIPTPFMYDLSVPHVLEVECTWKAIQDALDLVTDDMAAAGVLIRVKPGVLYGNYAGTNTGGTNMKVGNVGSKTWPMRVTVAPRDGFGSVTVQQSETNSAKGSFLIANVNNVCFAGFEAGAMAFRQCSGLALAWTQTGYLDVFNYQDPPEHTSQIELVEVFVDAAVNPNTPTRIRATAALRLYNGGSLIDASVVGSYIAAVFYQGNNTVPSTISIPIVDSGTNPAPITQNISIKDTVAFAGTEYSLSSNKLDGLSIDNSYIVAADVSLERYPIPSGAGIPNANSYKQAIGGRGQNITINNSVVAGIMNMNNGDATYPITSITSTYTDRTHTGASNPQTGGWGVPVGTNSTTAALVAMMPPEPTDVAVPGTPDSTKTYLRQIWNLSAPVLTSQPAATTSATAGDSVTLSVTVADPTLVIYQWYKDGSAIDGATLPSYTINGITELDAGLYTVSVTNGGGAVSASSQVTVGEDPSRPLPIIATHPAANTSVLAGTAVTLTVVAESPAPAAPALSYQWYKGGEILIGKTGASLALAGNPADAGSYTVKVTNENGTRASSAAVVEITGTPAGVPAQLPPDKSLLVGETLTLTASITGNPAPTIQWQYSPDNGVTWYDIAGATSSVLNVDNVTADMNGRLYRFVVTNPFGAVESNATVLEVLTERPPFPKPVEVSYFGPNGTHWPSLLDTPFMYDITIPNRIEVECTWAAIRTALQGLSDTQVAQGVLILVKPGALPGEGSNTVVLENLGSTAWPRRVTIAPRDGYGTVQIKNALNQLGGARFNNVHGVCFAGFEAATMRPSGCVNTAIAWTKLTTWLGLTAPAGNNSSNLEIVELALTDFAVKDDDCAQISGAAASLIKDVHIVGSYFAPHYRSTGSAHCDTLQIHTVQAKDIYFRDTAMFASSNTALQTGDVQGLTVRHCYFASSAPALGRYPFPVGYTPPNPDDVGKTFNGGGSNFKVYDCILIGRLTGNDGRWTEVQNTRSTASSALAAGGIGSWTVDATLSTSTPEDFNVPLPTDAYLNSIWKATAPSITTQPVGGIIQPGSSHTFTVAAQGTISLVYQWYKDGVAIPDANRASYTITNAGSAHDGDYSVTVTNAAGDATSSVVSLFVNIDKVAPSIDASPVATQNAVAGKNVSLSGSADGNPAPTYQWQVATSGNNWTNIDPSNAAYTGADSDTLTIVNPTTGMNGYKYRYVATNTIGSIESDASTLAVTAAALNLPVGIVADAAGSLYVSDAGEHTIHRLTSTGTLQVIAGASGTSGMVDGLRAEALLNTPIGLAVRSGTLYIADAGNSAIRGLTGSGTVTTIIDGTAGLKNAEGVTVASDGTLYIADTGNHVIRTYVSGSLSILAGTLNTTGTNDGTGAAALFNNPTRVAIASDGILYVADTGNNAIRVIAPSTGAVTTLAEAADGLFAPSGLLVSGSGAGTIVYVANTGNSTISEVASNGTVTTLVGFGGIDDIAGPPGFKDGVNQGAWFNLPEDVTVGTDGALYVADTGNTVIRKITFDTNDDATAITLKPTVKPVEPPPADIGPFNPGSSSAGGGAPSAWYLAFMGMFMMARLALTRKRHE